MAKTILKKKNNVDTTTSINSKSINSKSIKNKKGGNENNSDDDSDIESNSNSIDNEVDIDADIDVDISNTDDNLKDDDDIQNIDDDIQKDDDDYEQSENYEDEGTDNDEKEEKDYIENEETLKSKCYSKYARVDYDDLDFDELFGEETLSNNKNIRLSKPILTKYEFVRILTDRTKQVAQLSKRMLKDTENLTAKEIAKLELKNKIIPLIIERPVPNSNAERWKLSELEIPEHFFTV